MNPDTLTKKIEQLKEYLVKAKELARETSEEILSDFRHYHAAERLFQLIVDTCVDINVHLIRERVSKAPDDLQSTFIVLGEAGILDKDFAIKLAPVVGLRNRIIHRYDTLNRSEFIEMLKKELTDFDAYHNVVLALAKQE